MSNTTKKDNSGPQRHIKEEFERLSYNIECMTDHVNSLINEMQPFCVQAEDKEGDIEKCLSILI